MRSSTESSRGQIMAVTRVSLPLCLLVLLAGCSGGSDDPPAGSPVPPPAPLPPPSGPALFEPVSDAQWDETAVRKVLHAFAYGGQASEEQITLWARMTPDAAIMQMLTFDEHNLLLSPPARGNTDGLANRGGSLRALSDFWSSDDPANGVFSDLRPLHEFPIIVWYRAALSRGLNPFRQKIGLWETNYHMAVNFRVGVNGDQLFRYFDDIMSALAAGETYQDVLATAATSAAIARQYGHFTNVYVNGECLCNEDFAREYHQLFFGILGEYDPDYHEVVAIKNTAAALTDMRLAFDQQSMDFVDELVFGRVFHTPGPLDILNVQVGGNDALQRIDQLSQIAVEHPESLANLPVEIIGGLADDNLTDSKIAMIRTAWSRMDRKDLLAFLRAYAISELFHDELRYKFLTSVDRHFLIANQVNLSNEETYLELYTPYDIEEEDVVIFAPRHNVFGAQTGREAADSADVFRNNFNRVTSEHWRYRLPEVDRFGRSWEKDWAEVAPRDGNGTFRVDQMTEWLWNRFVADGLKNLGVLERAHLYAYLAVDADLIYLVNRMEIEAAGGDPDDLDQYDFDRVVTTAELESNPELETLIDWLAEQLIPLDSTDQGERQAANARIGQAINFIAATPYVFAQEGR